MDPITGLRGGSKEFRNVAIARAKKKKKDGLLSNGAVLRRSLNVLLCSGYVRIRNKLQEKTVSEILSARIGVRFCAVFTGGKLTLW
jgi:hypothetical protein